MRQAILVLFLFFGALSANTALAQQPLTIEHGTPEELRGVTKIYVEVSDRNDQRHIINHIRKKLPDLKISGKREEAEIWLWFRADMLNYPGNSTTAVAGSAVENYEVAAVGSVVKPIGKGRVRMLMSFDTTVKSIVYPRLSTKFARRFTKAYQKANGRVSE